ncbi:putative Histone-lysine N-methyltransferase ATXR5 [Dorcoceras hygrometricum]|uniref:Putative Histone-lysine N-methyltransferase ATXR5 n=1 Tax=Dorcoceras hygrometricum TaxID=472368 RepID=A0A2Z7B9N5_9LAMI|nr:putative Histone-lysine N-methyltransferase ATXR5 [Dorcoceras hygrometricum]
MQFQEQPALTPIVGPVIRAGDSFDDVMLCVGIEVADVSFAAGSLARIVLCFGSWRQQRLRGFQQESVIEFRNGVVLRNQLYCRQSMGVIALIVCLLVVNAGQPSCSAKRMRRRLGKLQRRVLMLLLVAAWGSVLCCFGLASGCPAAGRRAATPHSHLPAGIVATMRRVVNYHSSWARQQQVELFDASGNPGSTAGRGFNPAGGAPGGG